MNIGNVCRWLIAGVFMYSGFIKCLDVNQFAKNIDTYITLPFDLAQIFAIGIALLELAIGILLFVGYRIQTVAFFTSLMLLMFMVVLIHALLTDAPKTCGCFGVDEPLSWMTIGRDMLLLVCVVILLIPQKHHFSIDEWHQAKSEKQRIENQL
jgi:putative oxidoreductase